MSVYIALNVNTKLVKIGFTKNMVSSRLMAIANEVNAKIDLLRSINGERPTEQAFHRKFSALRVEGEWFNFSKEMLTYTPMVEEIIDVHCDPRFKEYMDAENIDQEELARRAGYSPSFISRLMAGKRSMTLEVAFQLHNNLGIPLNKLRPDVWKHATVTGSPEPKRGAK
jgi:hypothetical protein